MNKSEEILAYAYGYINVSSVRKEKATADILHIKSILSDSGRGAPTEDQLPLIQKEVKRLQALGL